MPEAVITPAAVTTPPAGDGKTGDKGTTPETPQNPTKFKFKFDDADPGSENEVDLSDIKPEGDETPAAGDEGFKFESLDAIKESHADLYKAIKAEISKAQRYGKYGA